MAARGPDSFGEWFAEDGAVALGHRRLSIIDLSETGNQPMVSACGRYHIVFNGEIYNYQGLRADLEQAGCRLRGGGDTEVLLELFARQGPDMFPRLRGMFALAIWDVQTRRLILARDALGIKPLYYAAQGGVFWAASQVLSLIHI